MWKIVVGLVVVGLLGVAIGATEKEKTVEVMEIGSPIIMVDVNGKPTPRALTSVVLLLRSDGLIGWTLSEEAAEQFKKEEKEGLKIPRQYGGKRK